MAMALQPICSAQPCSSNSASIARREFSSNRASGIGMVSRSVSSPSIQCNVTVPQIAA
jgi:hypothetical protein